MTSRLPAARTQAGQQGFTLVELLVAMILLSMLALGLASVMGTVSQAQERIDIRLERMDQRNVSIGFLRSVLGQVSAVRRQVGMRKQGESDYFFVGGPQAMQWLGIMPARYGAGGRMHFQLALQGDALVLRFTPWRGVEVEPDWAQAQSYVLARQVTGFILHYQDGKRGAAQWQTQWSDDRKLPTAVQIELQTWPMTVIAMHQTAATSWSSRPVFGGTVR